MSAQELFIRSHVRFHGGAALSLDNTADFPETPNQGQFALVSGVLYMYATMSGVSTWFPLTNKKNTYIHYQTAASTKWVVSHNYDTTDLMFFAYDGDGNMLIVSPTFVDGNTFELNFGSALKGKVVVFVQSELWLPSVRTGDVEATNLTVSANATLGDAATDTLTVNAASTFNAAVTHNVVNGTASIDCTAGNYFTGTLSSNATYTFNNPPAGFYLMVLELTNAGSYVVTWPASVKWPGATAPTLTANGVDVLAFYTDDSGVTWRGVQSMAGSA